MENRMVHTAVFQLCQTFAENFFKQFHWNTRLPVRYEVIIKYAGRLMCSRSCDLLVFSRVLQRAGVDTSTGYRAMTLM